jgi:hypothetical protein
VIAKTPAIVERLRSPLLHRVYTRLEKSIIDEIACRGDRLSCPEVERGDQTVLAPRLQPNHIGEPKIQILVASPLRIHSLASQQTQSDTVAD